MRGLKWSLGRHYATNTMLSRMPIKNLTRQPREFIPSRLEVVAVTPKEADRQPIYILVSNLKPRFWKILLTSPSLNAQK